MLKLVHTRRRLRLSARAGVCTWRQALGELECTLAKRVLDVRFSDTLPPQELYALRNRRALRLRVPQEAHRLLDRRLARRLVDRRRGHFTRGGLGSIQVAPSGLVRSYPLAPCSV